MRQVGCEGENPGELSSPTDVTFIDDDEILVADQGNHRVQQFNVQSAQNFVNSFGRQGTEDGNFEYPVSVCMDYESRVIVADYENHRVQVLTRNGAPIFKFGDGGDETLNCPVGCACLKNRFIVADSLNSCLKVYDSSGNLLCTIGERGNANGQFLKPCGLCVDQHENILVSDEETGHVQQFTKEGNFSGKTVSKLTQPWGIATMPDGRILVCDSRARKVLFLK